jgi:hypothetical protein
MSESVQSYVPQLVFVRDVEGDVIVRCPYPECHHEGPLMRDFSLLKAGFNGIKSNDADDCDMQECGFCERRSAWDNIQNSDEESAP